MRKIFLFIVLAMFFVACHSTKKISATATNIKATAKLNGNWKLEMLFASDNNWVKVPSININLDDKTFSGNSGCNSINGRFTLSENYLGFDKNILSTKMACADANSNRNEKSFLSALLKINQFTINKDELELGQGEIVLMRFKRAD